MIYESRIYKAVPGKLPAINARFANHTIGFFEEFNIGMVGFWNDVIGASKIKALAHITGGGLMENIPRILPAGCGVELDGSAWTAPPVFGWLQQQGKIADDEMARTFNCGVGMTVIVDPADATATVRAFAEQGETAVEIGRVVESPSQAVAIQNLSAALSAA